MLMEPLAIPIQNEDYGLATYPLGHLRSEETQTRSTQPNQWVGFLLVWVALIIKHHPIRTRGGLGLKPWIPKPNL